MFQSKGDVQSSVQANAEVARLFEIERDLTEKRRRKITEIEAIRHGAAEAIVDGTVSVEDAASRIAQLQPEVHAAGEAIAIARLRRVTAIKHRFQSEAIELRTAAARYRQEAADILKHCESPLAKLSQLQGIPYDASVMLAQRNSGWAASVVSARPLDECQPGEALADIGASYLVPRSRGLRDQAKDLEQKARALDAREIPTDGTIERPTVAEILTDEHFLDAEMLAPAAYKIESWAAALEVQIQRDRPAGITGPKRYKIAWRSGELEVGDCCISYSGSGSMFGDPSFSLGTPA